MESVVVSIVGALAMILVAVVNMIANKQQKIYLESHKKEQEYLKKRDDRREELLVMLLTSTKVNGALCKATAIAVQKNLPGCNGEMTSALKDYSDHEEDLRKFAIKSEAERFK